MPTKLRFEVQGKSPLVYLTFYNDDFEKKLAKVNADDFDRIDFQLANEVNGFIPGEGLEVGDINDVKVFKNDELIYDDGIYEKEDIENDEEWRNELLESGMMIVMNYNSGAVIDNVLSDKQNIEASDFGTTLNDFTQKYNYCSIETVECHKAKGTVTIDIEEDIVPHYKDFEWVTMGYDTDTKGLAAELVSCGIDTSLIGVKYKNTFYQFDCTNEGGFNEYTYYKKVDGQWEWAEDIQSKIEEMS
jgi:hypothetical protein